jgi:hypothetical protein
VIEQVPAVTSVTVLPATVQTAGLSEANATANPELAVAFNATGEEPRISLLGAANVIVWPDPTEEPRSR